MTEDEIWAAKLAEHLAFQKRQHDLATTADTTQGVYNVEAEKPRTQDPDANVTIAAKTAAEETAEPTPTQNPIEAKSEAANLGLEVLLLAAAFILGFFFIFKKRR